MAWVARALHGVTVPLQTDDVDCQKHPCCRLQSFCVASCGHGVSVPLHGVAPVDQLHPGVVHVACVVS